MKIVTFTEFRSHASGMLSQVEQGESLLVLRHGRPVATVSPVTDHDREQPSWKKPGLRLISRGTGLSAALLEERDREDVL